VALSLPGSAFFLAVRLFFFFGFCSFCLGFASYNVNNMSFHALEALRHITVARHAEKLENVMPK
jgi:hypothetical protein